MNLKSVRYAPNEPLLDPIKTRVAYKFYGMQIVLSGLYGIMHGRVGSTMNYCNEVIEAITCTEHINPRLYDFFDLQTHRSYSGFQSGDYNFNYIEVEWGKSPTRPIHTTYYDCHCAPIILKDFAMLISAAADGKIRNLPEYRGSLKPLPPDFVWTEAVPKVFPLR